MSKAKATKLPLAKVSTKASAKGTAESYSRPGSPTRSTMESKMKAAQKNGNAVMKSMYHAAVANKRKAAKKV